MSEGCSRRGVQSLGRQVASPGNDSSHPKGVLDMCGLIWRSSSFPAGKGAPGRETLKRCWACGWFKLGQANPTRTFCVEMNILKPRPCPKLCESAGLWSFGDKISATLLMLYQSSVWGARGSFHFCSELRALVFFPHTWTCTHALLFCSSLREAPTVSNRWWIWQAIFNAA